MDVLLAAHPQLAPNLLKVLSESLTSAENKVKELESALADQGTIANTYSLECSRLEAENQQLQTALAAAEIKREEREGFGDDRLATLQRELDTLRSDKDAITQRWSREWKALQLECEQHSTDLATARAELIQLQEQCEQRCTELEACKSDLQDKYNLSSAELSAHKADALKIHQEHEVALQEISEELQKARADVAQEQGVAEAARRSEQSEDEIRSLTCKYEVEKKNALDLQQKIHSLACKHEAEKKKVLDLQKKTKSRQEEFERKKGALGTENAQITLQLNAERATLQDRTREFTEMKDLCQSERAKNAKLQTEQFNNASTYEASIREYMQMTEQSSILLLEYEQKNAMLVAQTGILGQDLDRQRVMYNAKLKEYAEKNVKLESDCLRLASQTGTRSQNHTSAVAKAEIVNAKPTKDDRHASFPISLKMERVLYCNFMGAFPGPGPSERPSLDSLQGIFQVANEMDYFTHKILTNRKSAHFPMRQIWAGRNFVHTLVYGPTEEYRRSTTGTTNHTGPPCIFSLRGEVCDLFVTGQDRYIYYAGMYVVHSLRHIHPPGSVIPPDVAPAGIQRAIAAALADKGNNAEVPIPNHELKTECFGLQCIGFDTKLYQVLLDKFNRTVRIPKRKTSKGDTGNEPVAKAPKT